MLKGCEPHSLQQNVADLELCNINRISHAQFVGIGFSTYGGLDGNQQQNAVYIERAMVI